VVLAVRGGMKKDELAGKDHTLMFGPYKAPACAPGAWLDDAHYGKVQVGGFTSAPLSWPKPRRKGPPAPVLTSELVSAIQTESAYAVAYWWGVSISQVNNWRRWLGVDRLTEGTARLLASNAREMSPEIRESIAARRRGKPQPEHVKEHLLKYAKAPKSKEWAVRAKAWMVEAQKRARSTKNDG
jgi:hypothetical protein